MPPSPFYSLFSLISKVYVFNNIVFHQNPFILNHKIDVKCLR
jgi:hypothetical protein